MLSCILDRWEVTEEGRGMVERGSHEAVVWGLIGEAGIPQPELFNAAGFNFVPFKLHMTRFENEVRSYCKTQTNLKVVK